MATTVLLCGVGGQGTILAAHVLAHAALAAGYDVKLSEIHGMAQRGGAVSTTVRFGEDVNSMVTDTASADVIVAFEMTEALRNLGLLAPEGILIVNRSSIEPLPVLTGAQQMPPHPEESLYEAGALLMDATRIALESNAPRSSNIVLLGALFASMEFPDELVERVIAERVPPKTVDVNIDAYRAGKAEYLRSISG